MQATITNLGPLPGIIIEFRRLSEILDLLASLLDASQLQLPAPSALPPLRV
jgi:hypothetical protein